MPIEIRIPKEITEYKEKILFGLSIRQLVCFSVAITSGIGTYYFTSKLFNEDVASYVVILEVMPIFAIGFIKKNGFPFEKYVGLMLSHKFGKNRREYATDLLIDEVATERDHAKPVKKWRGEKGVSTIPEKKQAADKNIRECTVFEITAKSRKRKRKEAIREIKAARKEFRNEKQADKKTTAKGSSTSDSTANYQV